MLAKQQTWAGQEAPAAIDCPCNNNPGSPTGSAIVDKTAKDLERKLANLATKKCRLALANKVQLAELELVKMRQEIPHSIHTIDKWPRHTQACTPSNANKSPTYKKP